MPDKGNIGCPQPSKIDPIRQPQKDGINFIANKKEKEVTLNPLLIDVCDSYLLIYGRPAPLENKMAETMTINILSFNFR